MRAAVKVFSFTPYKVRSVSISVVVSRFGPAVRRQARFRFDSPFSFKKVDVVRHNSWNIKVALSLGESQRSASGEAVWPGGKALSW